MSASLWRKGGRGFFSTLAFTRVRMIIIIIVPLESSELEAM